MSFEFCKVSVLTAVFFSLMLPLAAVEHEEEAPSHECTSWLLFPDMTGENTTILHKSRDSQNKNVFVSMNDNGGRKWIGLGGKDLPCMAFNSSGLAGVMNGGEKCTDISKNPNGKSTPQQLLEIISTCDTAKQATDKLVEFIKNKDYIPRQQGSIFFFADTKEGYIIEFTANYYNVQKCDTGYVSRANIWHHPGMEKYALTDYRVFLIEATREFVIRQTFNEAYRKNGKVTIEDIINLSRVANTPKGAPNNRSLCCSWTNSTASFVIDRDYPDVLSTAYMSVGHPRHTVVLPFPICLKQIPAELTDAAWAGKSYARLKVLKTRSEVPAPWLAFEKESLGAYKTALAQAREMLKKGDRKGAVELLNNSFESIWQKARVLPGIEGK